MRWAKLALLFLALLLFAAQRPPWRARKRPDIKPNHLAAERVKPGDWAAEPPSPASIDPERFARAIKQICGWMPPSRPGKYAGWILEYGGEFDVDPFLLAALVYRESRCRSDKEELGGLGLTLLAPRMFRDGYRKRVYRYKVKQGDTWVEREKALPRYPFARAAILRAQSNLYLTAGLLSVLKEQHASVDEAFTQVPHRHYVSHWVWGDRVRSARAEDRILTDRRRLLQYYGAQPMPEPLRWQGLLLGSPLDGAPRVVSSGLGFGRDGGRRSHRGIDVESEFGEPVRAIADGKVVFSGVDLPGRQSNVQLSPEHTNAFTRSELGRGGRYLCLRHARDGAPSLRTCYMHLETVEVTHGDVVQRGQRIGTVGRTGMKRSSPHLHLETHLPKELLDPLELLRGHVIGEPVEFEEPGSRKRKKRRKK
ncbi:MAG: M23 family metallopeptidase [Myxococcales bacterium]|nr:M23 family metallopeptidase [Myxococcales bacterium]